MKRPDSAESFDRKARLHVIGNAVSSALPEPMLTQYRELVSVGEFRVALENLCSNLDDSGVVLASEEFELIRQMALELAVPERFWRPLEKM